MRRVVFLLALLAPMGLVAGEFAGDMLLRTDTLADGSGNRAVVGAHTTHNTSHMRVNARVEVSMDRGLDVLVREAVYTPSENIAVGIVDVCERGDIAFASTDIGPGCVRRSDVHAARVFMDEENRAGVPGVVAHAHVTGNISVTTAVYRQMPVPAADEGIFAPALPPGLHAASQEVSSNLGVSNCLAYTGGSFSAEGCVSVGPGNAPQDVDVSRDGTVRLVTHEQSSSSLAVQHVGTYAVVRAGVESRRVLDDRTSSTNYVLEARHDGSLPESGYGYRLIAGVDKTTGECNEAVDIYCAHNGGDVFVAGGVDTDATSLDGMVSVGAGGRTLATLSAKHYDGDTEVAVTFAYANDTDTSHVAHHAPGTFVGVTFTQFF